MAAAIPFIIMAVATVVQTRAAEEQADAEKKINTRRAKELEKRAQNTRAAGQRDMLEERRRKELIASRAVALTAAFGGDTTDPTIVDLIADINGEGAYRESVAIYNAEEEARQLEAEADVLYESNKAIDVSTSNQTSARVVGAASSMYGMYGGGGYSGYTRYSSGYSASANAGARAGGAAGVYR